MEPTQKRFTIEVLTMDLSPKTLRQLPKLYSMSRTMVEETEFICWMHAHEIDPHGLRYGPAVLCKHPQHGTFLFLAESVETRKTLGQLEIPAFGVAVPLAIIK